MAAAGEEKAWEILTSLEPDGVSTASLALFDRAAGMYSIYSYGIEFKVSPSTRNIISTISRGDILLERFGDLFRLSLLWYLVSAKAVPCTGRLVRLQDLPGGDAFTRGSHALPLEKIAARYGNDRGGFLSRGRDFGAEVLSHGDACLRLLPFPRVPVLLTLWLGDDEFPARTDLIFDSSCALQLPPDIAWSVALMTLLVML